MTENNKALQNFYLKEKKILYIGFFLVLLSIVLLLVVIWYQFHLLEMQSLQINDLHAKVCKLKEELGHINNFVKSCEIREVTSEESYGNLFLLSVILVTIVMKIIADDK